MYYCVSVLRRTTTTKPLDRKQRDKKIRERYAAGETISDIARDLKLSPQRVHQIVNESE